MNIKIMFAIALAWTSLLPFSQENSKPIEGTWVIEEAELGGKKLDSLKGAKLTMADGKYEFQNDKGDYKLSVVEKLKALDIIGKEGPNQGKTILTIYQLDGDRLKICYDLTGKARPTEFKTEAGSRLFLVSYRREKEKAQ